MSVKTTRKALIHFSLVAVGALVVIVICLFAWLRSEQHLPGDQEAQRQFAAHKADYVRFAALLRREIGSEVIGSDGSIDMHAANARVVPEYRDLIRSIGAKFVTVREDGSIEFTLWGLGCAICSDSYMGVRYSPADADARGRPGWTQKVVASLDSKSLPQENGSIADGLYVVEIEPEWFAYRLEYRE
jgi:hypothetical protein